MRGFTFPFVMVTVAVLSAGATGFTGMDADDLPVLKEYRAARVSSHDRSGGNSDALSGIAPGQTAVLADIEGPGMIVHIWFTIAAERFHGRKIVLRMYWDDETDPSVECPVNDFFCAGHGINAEVRSLPITVTSEGRARNCFFKMPFNKRARIEIANEGLESISAFYYYVDYRQYERPFENTGYFHARYRQEYPAVGGRNYLICDAQGRGHFVGCNLSIESNGDSWWGEGDDRFFIDGEEYPSFHGTGSEDYLCDAWGVWPGHSLYYGSSIHEGKDYAQGKRYTSYRFHIADPIPFAKSLRAEIEHWGAKVDEEGREVGGLAERADNWSSVAYWYQVEPHKPWEPMAPVDKRLPREAGKDIVLLRFLREAKECSSEGPIEALRRQYETLMADETLRRYRLQLAVRMAMAEKSAGQTDRARSLLNTFAVPFVPRDVAADVWAVSGRPAGGVVQPLFVPWEDGSDRRIECGERWAIVTQREAKQPYVYFALPDGTPLRDCDCAVRFRIECYSDGRAGAAVCVEYDSHYSSALEDSYRKSEVVAVPAVKGWHTLTVTCPRARLVGRQNGGADFRIATAGDGDLSIGAVELEKAGTGR